MKVRYPAAVFAAALVALLGGYLAPPAPVAHAKTEAAALRVIDGDTIEVDGRVVQLFGIDAPELGQACRRDGKLDRCGLHAAFALRKLLFASESPLACEAQPDGSEVCRLGHEDVSVVLLHQGYATALAGAFVDYQDAQAAAKNAGLGIWGGDFVPPEEWRAGKRLPVREGEEPETCPIKAVVGVGDTHFYYVPTEEDYESITLHPERGDRNFCSDDEARADDWTLVPR
jgi:endonuclease YncB( thermonuclease family)